MRSFFSRYYNRAQQRAHLQKGFTLLEILIVLVIMAILAGAASIAIVGADRTAKVKNFSEGLVQLFPVIEQQAILQPAQIGLVFANHSYTFYQYVPDEDDPTQGDWQAIQGDTVFNSRSYSNDITLHIELTETTPEVIPTEDQTIRPQIIFYSSGDVTPFKMTIAIKDKKPLYQLNGSANGEVNLVRLDALQGPASTPKTGAQP